MYLAEQQVSPHLRVIRGSIVWLFSFTVLFGYLHLLFACLYFGHFSCLLIWFVLVILQLDHEQSTWIEHQPYIDPGRFVAPPSTCVWLQSKFHILKGMLVLISPQELFMAHLHQ